MGWELAILWLARLPTNGAARVAELPYEFEFGTNIEYKEMAAIRE